MAATWSLTDALHTVHDARREAKPNGWLLLLADRLMTPAQRDGVFSAHVEWAPRQPWWYPRPRNIPREAIAGRLSWDSCIDLAKAQTHTKRGVNLGSHRGTDGWIATTSTGRA